MGGCLLVPCVFHAKYHLCRRTFTRTVSTDKKSIDQRWSWPWELSFDNDQSSCTVRHKITKSVQHVLLNSWLRVYFLPHSACFVIALYFCSNRLVFLFGRCLVLPARQNVHRYLWLPSITMVTTNYSACLPIKIKGNLTSHTQLMQNLSIVHQKWVDIDNSWCTWQ